ncbi:unnamed protein product [Ectocarpus sp. 12 AP-2014]
MLVACQPRQPSESRPRRKISHVKHERLPPCLLSTEQPVAIRATCSSSHSRACLSAYRHRRNRALDADVGYTLKKNYFLQRPPNIVSLDQAPRTRRLCTRTCTPPRPGPAAVRRAPGGAPP